MASALADLGDPQHSPAAGRDRGQWSPRVAPELVDPEVTTPVGVLDVVEPGPGEVGRERDRQQSLLDPLRLDPPADVEERTAEQPAAEDDPDSAESLGHVDGTPGTRLAGQIGRALDPCHPLEDGRIRRRSGAGRRSGGHHDDGNEKYQRAGAAFHFTAPACRPGRPAS